MIKSYERIELSTGLYNSIVEMEKIERQEGRDGSLAERRRSEEDRRSGVRDRRKGDRRVLGDRRMAPSGCL